MKLIIIDARCIFDSGVGVYLREVLQRLIKEDVQIELIMDRAQKAQFEALKISVKKVHVIKYGRFSFFNLLFLNKLIKHADVYLMPSLTVSPIFSSVQKMTVVHDVCPIRMYKSFGYITAIAYWFMLGIQLVSSRKVIAISEFTKNEIKAYYPSYLTRKIDVIYNGLSTRLNDKYKENIREKPYLLCVGNVKPHKNIVNFVNYFTNHSKFSKKFILVIVGQSDGFRTGEKPLICYEDNVEFTGFVSDEELGGLYDNASAFVFPSFYEGFGLPILEAMSFNLPILASDIPVFKEIAQNTIEYFNPNNFNDFDTKLEILFSRSNSDFSKILEQFTWENNVKKMIGIINR
ncbi:glycosyltransferase family 4 protein [Pseudoalteromonas sp. 20-92]|uniref:glycosyltransferase family 4 protein n=1 Tax=unclassified Pseudoalteromonas TaxID=194690 RepID=UPI0002AAE449|nr:MULTISPECIES: glycosyltransferase family 1 protein [unclassified Pseudoalteromonas]ALQ09313.1 group 1 glycosyl transferase [Pseudoalteromonas sp. Bsw20308]MDQ2045222.1 glycosyltransferase family 4 protein [Pseudoalteromonas sp. 20-92]